MLPVAWEWERPVDEERLRLSTRSLDRGRGAWSTTRWRRSPPGPPAELAGTGTC
jgi:hypothetical protein